MVTLGRTEDSEFSHTLKAVMACLPSPPATARTFALAEPGKLEAVMEQIGLIIHSSGDVSCPFEYPDDETAWKTINSSGPLASAVRAVGEETIKKAVLASLLPFRTPDGGYRQENLMHYAIATA